MAIANACNITEALAYNLIARRVDFEHSPCDAARAIKQEYSLRRKEQFRAIRTGTRMSR